MYGSIARITAKPGITAAFITRLRELNPEKDPGLVAEYFYQMDEPNVYYMAVVFESKELGQRVGETYANRALGGLCHGTVAAAAHITFRLRAAKG